MGREFLGQLGSRVGADDGNKGEERGGWGLPGLCLVQTLLRDAHDLLQDATDVLLLLLLTAEAVELHHGVGLAQLPLGQSDGAVQHHVVVVLHRCTAPGAS